MHHQAWNILGYEMCKKGLTAITSYVVVLPEQQ